MTTLTIAERFALDEWLSDYPEDVSYKEIIEMILIGTEDVSVWAIAEGYPEYQIIQMIDATLDHFARVTNIS